MSVKSLRCATGYIEIVERGRQGIKGDDGLILGGLTGQILTKASDQDGDTEWTDPVSDNTTEEHIPVKRGGTFEDSGLYVNEDGNLQTTQKIITESGLCTVGNTIEIGDGFGLKSSGPQLVAQSAVTGVHYEVPYQSIDKNGSGELFTVKSGAESNEISQPIDTDALIAPLNVPIIATDNEVINAIYFRTNGAVNNLRFQVVSVTTGKPVLSYPDTYKYERGEGVDITGAGEHKIDLFYEDTATPMRLTKDEVVLLTVLWDASTGAVLGDSGTGTPYFAIDIQLFEFKNIALIEDLQNQGGFRGYFADEAELNLEIPVGNEGDTAVVIDPTNNVFFWDTDPGVLAWVDTGTAAGGDMFKSIYDPSNKSVDAFNMDNMDEGVTAKVYSSSERLKLQGIEAGAEINRSNAELKTDYESNADTNAFTDDEKSKLTSVEFGADANQTDSEIKTQYENNVNTNAFDDTYKSAVDTNTTKVSFPGWDSNPDHTVTKEPTGFPLNSVTSEVALEEAVMSFDDLTRTFTIEPASVDFSCYENGIQYLFNSARSVQITDVEGIHFVYFDLGVLQETTVLDLSFIYSKPFVAVMYWNQVDQELIYLGEERHGLKMDGHTHVRLHEKDGTIYLNGLGLIDFAIGDGSANVHAQFGAELGDIKDEDILLQRNAVLSTTGMPVFYKEGATGIWRRDLVPGFSVVNTGTGRIAWNEFNGSVWQKSEVIDNGYVLAHIFASNDINYPFFSTIGQDEYLTIGEARDGALQEISSLITDGMPFVEFVAVGTIIYQTSDTFTNSVKGRVIENSVGSSFIDWRGSDISPTGTQFIVSHNDLPEIQGGQSGEYYHLNLAEKNAIVFGTNYNIYEDNAQSSTTSDIPIDKLSVTTPTLEAGTYRLEWSAGISGLTDRATEASCLLDGVDTIGVFTERPGIGGLVSCVGNFTTRVLASGTHTLQIQYNRGEGQGTALIEQARVEIYRIA